MLDRKPHHNKHYIIFFHDSLTEKAMVASITSVTVVNEIDEKYNWDQSHMVWDQSQSGIFSS